MFGSLMRPKFSPAMAYSFFHFGVVMFLLPFCALAQNNGTVSVGSTLTVNGTSRTWLSPSGDFAFGFRQLQDQDLFILSIWYDKIPDTIVWFNNTLDPVRRGSTVQLAQTGLVLRDPQGRLLWRTEDLAEDVDHGFMNDTGNFILMRIDNMRLWQSFDFPADTILPLQNLLPGSVLISRKSENNFKRGRFYLRFLENGNLVLRTRSVPTNREDDDEYYNSQTSAESNYGSAASVQVIFDERGSIYILRRNNQRAELSPRSIPSASENYFRATLSFDGVFTHYYHPRTFSGEPSWTALWWQPDNICIVELVAITMFAESVVSEDQFVNVQMAINCSIQMTSTEAAGQILLRAVVKFSRPLEKIYTILFCLRTQIGQSLTFSSCGLLVKLSAGKPVWRIVSVLLPFSETIAAGRRSFLCQMGG